jgi:hypothetical protein
MQGQPRLRVLPIQIYMAAGLFTLSGEAQVLQELLFHGAGVAAAVRTG